MLRKTYVTSYVDENYRILFALALAIRTSNQINVSILIEFGLDDKATDPTVVVEARNISRSICRANICVSPFGHWLMLDCVNCDNKSIIICPFWNSCVNVQRN